MFFRPTCYFGGLTLRHQTPALRVRSWLAPDCPSARAFWPKARNSSFSAAISTTASSARTNSRVSAGAVMPASWAAGFGLRQRKSKAASLARSSGDKPSSAAARASRVVAFVVFKELVQAAVQASGAASVSGDADCCCESWPPGLHPGGRGFETLSAQWIYLCQLAFRRSIPRPNSIKITAGRCGRPSRASTWLPTRPTGPYQAKGIRRDPERA
jgi:hypothetical protein